MNPEVEQQIESCLAYHVLRDPERWIGAPRTTYLDPFLHGARIRASLAADPSFDHRYVSGILDLPEFYLPLVAATGHPTLMFRWANALELTHLSFAEGCSALLEAALAWHRTHGPMPDLLFDYVPVSSRHPSAQPQEWAKRF